MLNNFFQFSHLRHFEFSFLIRLWFTVRQNGACSERNWAVRRAVFFARSIL